MPAQVSEQVSQFFAIPLPLSSASLLLSFPRIRLPLFPTASTKRHHALCIGIANYSADGSLKNPIHDAEDMSALLTKSGFQSTLLCDPSCDELCSAVLQ